MNHPGRFRVLLLAGAFAACTTVGAQAVYQSVGPDGRIVYGDQPRRGGVPVLVVDGHTLNGFPVGAYDAAFARRR